MPNYSVASYQLIYVYTNPDNSHRGLVKVGRASLSSSSSIAQLLPNCAELNVAAKKRIRQQNGTGLNDFNLEYTELAVKVITMADGSVQTQIFDDHEVHNVMLNSGIVRKTLLVSNRPSEWFETDVATAKKAIEAVKEGRDRIGAPAPTNVLANTTSSIALRREQRENVTKTLDWFNNRSNDFLWNCKMRYGKTVTAYELMRQAGYKKSIVITHRPAVADGWNSDHDLIFGGTNHVFMDKSVGNFSTFDGVIDAQNERDLRGLVESGNPFVYFASIQDLRESRRVKPNGYNKNNYVYALDWDLVIIDEAHEGTQTPLGDAVINALRKENTKVLRLSGTPYNILNKFEDNVYTWTYVDEQKAKEEWDSLFPHEKNPYADLPKMNIYTFDLAEAMKNSYRYVADGDAFSFAEFFRVWTGDIEKDFRPLPTDKQIGDFVHEDDVISFLNLISKEDSDSQYPFSNESFREQFKHTFWIVPGVKEAKALSSLLKTHPVFKEPNYHVCNIAGEGDEEQPYDTALGLVKDCISEYDKTITLSCGKLTTGVTVKEWTGVMMLSGSSSTAAAGYMQAIFRVQSPGIIDGKRKENCYVFDFAPDRTLKVIADVNKVSIGRGKTDEHVKAVVGEFLNYLPVISIAGTHMVTYDVSSMMKQLKRITIDHAVNSGFDDDNIYDSEAGIVISGTDASVIAKLTDVVVPQKKGQKQKNIVINDHGLNNELRRRAEGALRKPKRDRTPEEEAAIEALKKQKEEQKKLYDLLRAVSIRLPLLFYGADADITEVIKMEDFVNIVDDESWEEFMPRGLKKDLFKEILRFYDEDVVIAAGQRIRMLAKQADEMLPSLRAKRIVEILSKFKNPDKETVLTPWRVVNMHLSETIGGYCFYNSTFSDELEVPELIECDNITANIFLNDDAQILEMNSKSGLYPLYMTYSLYMMKVNGKETDLAYETAKRLWNETLKNNIFVLCKTKMAKQITKRTLAGFDTADTNLVCLSKLIEERMKDKPRLANKLLSPITWNKEGREKMKFDAIVGNPPYQILDGGGRGYSAKPVYNEFVDVAKILSPRYISMITPSRWFSGGKGLDDFRESMLQDSRIRRIVDYVDNEKLFTGVAIAGGVNYFLWDSSYSGECEITSVRGDSRTTLRRRLNEYDIFVRNNSAVNLIHRIEKSSDRKMDEIVYTRNVFGINSDIRGLEEPSGDKSIRLYCSYKSNSMMVTYISEKDVVKEKEIIDKYKVIIGKVVPRGGEVGIDPSIGYRAITTIQVLYPNSVFTDTYLLLGVFDSEQEAINFAKYMTLRFPRFLLHETFSSMNISKGNFRFVPFLDYHEEWTDEKLFARYECTDDEIGMITAMMRPLEYILHKDNEDIKESIYDSIEEDED